MPGAACPCRACPWRLRFYARAVRVKSIGWLTDLRLRELEGAQILARADHVLVRTPQNPAFRWGNFMLLGAPPERGEAERSLGRFKAEFPAAGHVAIGIDGQPAETAALAEFEALGLRVELTCVLSAPRLRTPTRAAPQAIFRALQSDREWRQAIELSLAAHEESGELPGERAYLQRRMGAIRRVCEAGHGAWFGAFRDGEMHAGLGIFAAGSGLARFQSVDTHPAHRRQGLATHLLLTAADHARRSLGANTLMIAADPGYHAIEIYRSLGFQEHSRHVQLERGAPV
jgi:ribosomal protein S18 acetylase RimI-like enzyme